MQFRKYNHDSEELISKFSIGWLVVGINRFNGRGLLFGGAIRYFLIGEKLSDLDIKILLPQNKIQSFIIWLKNELTDRQIIWHEISIGTERLVFSIELGNDDDKFNIDLVIPLGVHGLFNALNATFAFNSLHQDIKTNLFFGFSQAWSDLDKNEISLVHKYTSSNQYYLYFRAIYLVFKTKFSLEKDLIKKLWSNKNKLLTVLNDFLIEDNPIVAKFLFMQVFAPRAINATLYDRILKKLGIFGKIQTFLRTNRKMIIKKLLQLKITKEKFFFGDLNL